MGFCDVSNYNAPCGRISIEPDSASQLWASSSSGMMMAVSDSCQIRNRSHSSISAYIHLDFGPYVVAA